MEYTRAFWIYFIITLLFVIIGLESLISASIPIWTITFWVLSQVFLMIAISESYKTSQNAVWINSLFIIMLIVSYIWTYEVDSKENNLDSITGIALLLVGLILCTRVKIYTIPFWALVAYLLVWFVIIFSR